MLGIGGGEWILVGLVALFVFGPEKLPTIARQAGAWTRDLRRVVAAARRDLDRELGLDTADLRGGDLTPRGFVRRHVLDGLDDEGPPPRARPAERPDQRPAPPRATEPSSGIDEPPRPPYDPEAT